MAQRAQDALSKFVRYSAIFGATVAVVSSSVYVVQAGHKAVIFDRFQGVKPQSKGEGLHFRIPFIQKPFIYEIRTRYTNILAETGSKDLQTVGVHLRLLYRPESEKLSTIHSNLGPDYDERILPSIGNEILKAVVAQYDASELITQREMVSTKIRDALTKRASDFNIMLDDVSITHFSFSKEFSGAIESKQVAQQEAERSKYIVAKSEQERRAAVIKAEGEAESARLIIEAMKNQQQGFIELRRIEAAREVAETLARARNITYIPSGSNILLTPGPAGNPPPQQQSGGH